MEWSGMGVRVEQGGTEGGAKWNRGWRGVGLRVERSGTEGRAEWGGVGPRVGRAGWVSSMDVFRLTVLSVNS